MADDTLVVIANQYDSEADALADFEDVRKRYDKREISDTFDAAVLTRKADGKVEIVKRVAGPTRHGAARGTGCRAGARRGPRPVSSDHPGRCACRGRHPGAGAGAIAGHMVSGMSRSDLKDLGEVLDNGTSGLVVVAATNAETRVEDATTRAKHQAKAQLQADVDAMKKELATL